MTTDSNSKQKSVLVLRLRENILKNNKVVCTQLFVCIHLFFPKHPQNTTYLQKINLFQTNTHANPPKNPCLLKSKTNNIAKALNHYAFVQNRLKILSWNKIHCEQKYTIFTKQRSTFMIMSIDGANMTLERC